jgi:hypothetical protein
MGGAAGVDGEDDTVLVSFASRELRRRGIPSLSNPAGLQCKVAVDGAPLCVLAKCEE